MSSRASTPGTEGSVSAVTEPLNDDHAMSVDEDAAERDASRVRRRWTRRRRNTGTRGNPLDWLGGAAEGDGPV